MSTASRAWCDSNLLPSRNVLLLPTADACFAELDKIGPRAIKNKEVHWWYWWYWEIIDTRGRIVARNEAYFLNFQIPSSDPPCIGKSSSWMPRPPLQHLHVFRQRRQRPSRSNRAVSHSHHWVVATPFSQSFGSDGMVWGYVNVGCCEYS